MKATIDIPVHFEKLGIANGMNDNEIQMAFVEFMEDMFEQSNTISIEFIHWLYRDNTPD